MICLILFCAAAVRAKMAADGFSDLETDQFFSGTLPPPTPSAQNSGSVPPPPVAAVTAQVAESVPVAAAAAAGADERFTKYDKMRKMLPEGE